MIRPVDPRGDLTRRKIVDAAIPLFAKFGYDGVSTREVASAADVNQPAIQYHFGSKDGLYRAAVALIAEDLHKRMQPVRQPVEQCLDDSSAQPAALHAAMMALLDGFTRLMLFNPGFEAWSDFLARAELENQELLTELAAAMWREVVEPLARALGGLMGHEEGEQPILAALAILGAVTTFRKRCLQKSIAKALGWNQIGARELDIIQTMVRQQADACLLASRERIAS